MIKSIILFTALMTGLVQAQCFSTDVEQNSVNTTLAQRIQILVDTHIRTFNIPNLVIATGNRNELTYIKSFGIHNGEDNTIDTIYDVASLTKLFTAAAVMKTVDEDKIKLKDNLDDIFPSADSGGFESDVTVENLLRHTSGYQAGLRNRDYSTSADSTFDKVLRLSPVQEIGTFLYSDLNFLILGKMLEKIYSQKLDVLVTQMLFSPLNLKSASYNPHLTQEQSCGGFCAPTTHNENPGLVHDPLSRHFNGVSGNAGIFLNAKDLSKFASLFVNQGSYCGQQILDEDSVEDMIEKKSKKLRGLGFDILSPFSKKPRGNYFTKGISFGHTGYTGTSLWIDPELDTFLVVLSNAVGAKNSIRSKKGFLYLLQALSNVVGKDALQRSSSK